jgi:hypothetical protein
MLFDEKEAKTFGLLAIGEIVVDDDVLQLAKPPPQIHFL